MGRITRVLFPGVKRRSPKIWVKIQIFRGILLRYLSIVEILSFIRQLSGLAVCYRVESLCLMQCSYLESHYPPR